MGPGFSPASSDPGSEHQLHSEEVGRVSHKQFVSPFRIPIQGSGCPDLHWYYYYVPPG